MFKTESKQLLLDPIPLRRMCKIKYAYVCAWYLYLYPKYLQFAGTNCKIYDKEIIGMLEIN